MIERSTAKIANAEQSAKTEHKEVQEEKAAAAKKKYKERRRRTTSKS